MTIISEKNGEKNYENIVENFEGGFFNINAKLNSGDLVSAYLVPTDSYGDCKSEQLKVK